ncbi:hypothetical protein M430DRAFT_211744 [Amorphotheca resinae ATCC 22711]|uniref:Uncharacterized protein n=1 Tax=Amorphotheca resinae ATCC 22711 TaxID=857342 RepID=A0A2T3B7Y6_AMORE|nr:hypothetical protein M430DRAFT_211744 [Amorphotheca resinae ATCC 22711]PSS22980.1 hypothetical protein M430DRAFT_211744 [Amorphotheca resinae ATCC 22711]
MPFDAIHVLGPWAHRRIRSRDNRPEDLSPVISLPIRVSGVCLLPQPRVCLPVSPTFLSPIYSSPIPSIPIPVCAASQTPWTLTNTTSCSAHAAR